MLVSRAIDLYAWHQLYKTAIFTEPFLFMKRLGCLFVVMVVFLTACQKDSDQSVLNINISDEIQMNLWEALSSNQRYFQFRLRTLDDLDCENYIISHELNVHDQRISISLNDLIVPSECVPGAAPGTGLVSMGGMEPGTYNIEINLKNNEIINEGLLIFSDNSIMLDMQTDHGIDFPYTTLLRVPEQTIWGYVEFLDAAADTETIKMEIYEMLQPLTTTLILPSGEYGHFSVADRRIESVKTGDTDIVEALFLLKQTATTDELRSALSDIRSRYDSSVAIHLYLSDGSTL